MPLSIEEKRIRRKESQKKYRDKNRDKINADARKQRKENPKRFAEIGLRYRTNNPETCKKCTDNYKLTENGKKNGKIRSWKSIGLLDEYEIIYDRYINTNNCDFCDVLLTVDRYNKKTTKCMDHCHITGLFRNILCNSCNAKLPRQT